MSAAFEAHSADLGYAMVLSTVADPKTATPEQITEAAWKTVPQVAPMFWTFWFMVAAGVFMLLFIGRMFWVSNIRAGAFSPRLLKRAVIAIPVPWLAAETGWFAAEYGRQPWTVDGLLVTLLGFVALYTVLLIIEMRLMLAAIQKGPVQDVALTEAWTADHNARLGAAQPAE